MTTPLHQAIAAIKAGDKDTGRQILTRILKDDPNNEHALLWMTQTLDSNEERIRYLHRVLSINPNNDWAKRSLAQLQQPAALPPQPVSPPQSPPSLRPLTSVTQEATKKCPYCAETIKAEAVVCRFCGRDLLNRQPQQPAPIVHREVHHIVTANEKDPNTAGCLNVLIAGLGYVYLGNILRAVITFFASYIIMSILLAMVAVDFGLCSGPLIIGVLFVLFFEARSAAKKHNRKIAARWQE